MVCEGHVGGITEAACVYSWYESRLRRVGQVVIGL